MELILYRTIGYQNTDPIPGSKLKSFTGNQKKCTKDAKQWIKDNRAVVGQVDPIWKWTKE